MEDFGTLEDSETRETGTDNSKGLQMGQMKDSRVKVDQKYCRWTEETGSSPRNSWEQTWNQETINKEPRAFVSVKDLKKLMQKISELESLETLELNRLENGTEETVKGVNEPEAVTEPGAEDIVGPGNSGHSSEAAAYVEPSESGADVKPRNSGAVDRPGSSG